jgi:Subtilisin-like serine proteases
MKCLHRLNRFAFSLLLMLSAIRGVSLHAADTITWNTNSGRVSADIRSLPVLRVLEGVSQLTGWHVFIESNATRQVSAKFNELPSGEALRILLGNLNFALVPQTNARPRLYVFHTVQRNATMHVTPGSLANTTESRNVIPNELLITLKPGSNINALDCLQNATRKTRLGNSNTYRIILRDAGTAKLARECLAGNPDVEAIESNLAFELPNHPELLANNAASTIDLDLKESSGDCKIIIGLIDTPVGSLGKDLDKFLLPGISVVEGSATANSDGIGHGPAMAETILRSLQATTGGKTSAKILPVNVYGNNSTTSTAEVFEGIYRAINAGANVINLSLGSPGDSPALHNLIQQASAKGIVFFGAAGNQPVTTPVYPAAYPEVIAVTAGDHTGQIADYANRGSFVDIMAPGTSVVPFNGQSYVISGTSTATAYASGIAAGLADANQNCPPGVISTMRSRLGVKLGQ